MGKVISLVNQKGGVGKTTTSINLSASLAYLGKKVLLLDFDPQGNSTTGIGMNKGDLNKTIYDVLIGECTIEEAIVHTDYDRLDLLASTVFLSGLESEFLEQAKDNPNFVKSAQLKDKLNLIKDKYDYIIIDCPPTLGIITINALNASNSVIIPVQCEFLALEGIMQLLSTIKKTKEKLNPELEVEGVLLTMLDTRANLGFEVVEEIRKYFKERVYNTIIPRLVRLAECPSHGKPILAYDPKCRATDAYINLAKEVIERNGQQ